MNPDLTTRNWYETHLQKDKYYFGSFFNLAYNNLEEAFNEIQDRLHIKGKIQPKGLLDRLFQENMTWTDYEKRIALFTDYFPVVEFLDKKNKREGENIIEATITERIAYFKDTFTSLLKTVDNLRNFYTHYQHDPITIDDSVFTFLDETLFKVVVDTKKNYLKEDNTKEIISNSLREELDKLYNLKIQSLAKKKKEIEEENKKRQQKGEKPLKPFLFSWDRTQIINSLFNGAFKSYIFENNGCFELARKAQTKLNDYNNFNNEADLNLTISTSGIIFLLSFFLSKKEITQLKSKIKGYKATIVDDNYSLEKNSLLFMATHRIYSKLAFKGVKKRIKTSIEGNKETLLMQILDEISKVPDVIYQQLSEKDKLKFVEDWNEFYKEENIGFNQDEEKVIHPVIRKRYENKFNYFAIRFLDEYANFPTLRFQVYLGNYLHDKRKKDTGNNHSIMEREIKEKITVFGRLSEINSAKADYFLDNCHDQATDEDEPGWELFPNPGYLFPKEPSNDDQRRQDNANKIGIRVKLLNQSLINKITEAKRGVEHMHRKDDKLKKNQIIEKVIRLNTDTQSKEPIIYFGEAIAFLSLNDIHSILYDFLKNGISGRDLEQKIIRQIEKQISEILDKNTDTKILKKYKNDTKGKTLNKRKLENDLQKENDILKDLKNKQEGRIYDYNQTMANNKYVYKRKHILSFSEKGKVAVWIANDMKRFFPQGFKSNWKGYQHSELQKSLAYYESSKEAIIALLNGLSFDQFPFNFKRCFDKQTLHEFYSDYLEERICYIEKIIKELFKAKSQSLKEKNVLEKCFVFMKKQNYQTNDLDTQVNRILSRPVFIERGFLDNKPTIIPKTDFDNNKGIFADWFVFYKNYTTYQKFYNESIYPLQITGKKERYKIVGQIRKEQKNDVYSLMMAEYLYKDIFKTSPNIQLSELFQTRDERLKNKQIANKGADNLNYIWNKRLNIELFDGKIKISQVKLKDVGNFRKYEYDERIKKMLAYEPGIPWNAYLQDKKEGDISSVYVVEWQIETYEKVRSEELLKEVQELEKYIYDNVHQKEILLHNGNPKFKKYIINGLLTGIKKYSDIKVLKEEWNPEKINLDQLKMANSYEQSCYVLIYIRNKFAHNQFPGKEFFDYCNEQWPIKQGAFYANYFCDLFKKAKEKLVNS